ncbi:MAG: hydrogenase expression/formation C-terminal domain-containing protein [Xanthomonadales bacterium]|nr:hydrogenase expression/formation C-terminal domain-containing protein [Xanthomonadales bacterium]
MTRVELPVRVATPAPPPNAGVLAILTEIADRLQRLAETGERSVIELQNIPMTRADRAALEGFLGPGEVDAKLDLMGQSTVRETGCRGVWWVEHRNPEGRVVSESLEITVVPSILVTPAEDIVDGAVELQERLNQWPASAGGEQDET